MQSAEIGDTQQFVDALGVIQISDLPADLAPSIGFAAPTLMSLSCPQIIGQAVMWLVRLGPKGVKVLSTTARGVVAWAVDSARAGVVRVWSIARGFARLVSDPATEIPRTISRFRDWLRQRPWDEIIIFEVISETLQEFVIFRGGDDEPVGEVRNDRGIPLEQQIDNMRTLYRDIESRQPTTRTVDDLGDWQAMTRAYNRLLSDLEKTHRQSLWVPRFPRH